MLSLNDNCIPERIKANLNIRKAAFKRAVGKQLKEVATEIADDVIKRAW